MMLEQKQGEIKEQSDGVPLPVRDIAGVLWKALEGIEDEIGAVRSGRRIGDGALDRIAVRIEKAKADALELLEQPRKVLELIVGLVALLPHNKPTLELMMGPDTPAYEMLLALGAKPEAHVNGGPDGAEICERAELQVGTLLVTASRWPRRKATTEEAALLGRGTVAVTVSAPLAGAVS